MTTFKENGEIVYDPVTASEKQAMTAWVSALTPLQNLGGLPLSSLRQPGSTVSLQRTEQIAQALVADGVLTVRYAQPGGRGRVSVWNKVVK